LNPEQLKLYQDLRTQLPPLLARLDSANKQQLHPALADGQTAIVLDAQLTNTKWHNAMPESREPVPLPEVACVWTVSDPGLLRAGASEYFDVLQASIKVLSEAAPDKVPPIELPKPKSRQFGGSTIYYYELPPMAGLDSAIAPNAGLSSDTMVVSLIPKATVRLLGDSSLERTGLLAEASQRPVASTWQFKTDRFVQMIRPWVNYGLQLAAQEGAQDPMIATHATAVLDVLECIRTCSGYSYFEDGALVSRVRSEFKDLEP
jgi:hypothetical protein